MGAERDVDRVLAELNARISVHVATSGTRYAFATYVDPALDAVVVETDAPRDLLDSLLGDDRRSPYVVVRHTTISDMP